MATQNPDTTNVNVESTTEVNVKEEQNSFQNSSNTSLGPGPGGRGGGRGRGRGGGPGRFQGGGGGRGGGPGGQEMRGGGPRRFNQDRNNDQQGPRKRPFGDSQERMDRGGDRSDRFNFDKIVDRLNKQQGPTYELPLVDTTERKFAGKNRLYVGNIGNEISESDITELFQKYGETSELFMNAAKNFAFIKLDYHANAEKAKRELDGSLLKGRNLKVRYAPNGSAIKVKNLNPYVSNELLHYSFSVFGDIERCLVYVDERGRSIGEGMVEFVRKGSALAALRKCNEGCFFLTSSLRPCVVEPFELNDDADGCQDKFLNRKHPEFMRERDVGPRFANEGSFEYEYGTRWKQLLELYKQKEDALKKELELEKEKLEAQMEYAKYEHETEMLRDQLRAREMDRDRQKRDWEMKERQAEELRARTEEQMRRQEEDMQARMVHQEEEMRRRQQENNLFMQAHELDSMLNQQEQAYDQPANSPFDNGGTNLRDPKTIVKSFEQHNNRFERPNPGGDTMGNRAGGRGGGMAGQRGHWVNENRRDDYQNKRRRY